MRDREKARAIRKRQTRLKVNVGDFILTESDSDFISPLYKGLLATLVLDGIKGEE